MADEKLLIDIEGLSKFKTEQDSYNLKTFKLKSDSTDLKGAVRYDAAQNLSDGEKAQARLNLGIEITEGGGTAVAEDEIYVITATAASMEDITITQESADFLRNYTGDKPLYIKIEPVGLYLLYDITSQHAGMARSAQILTLRVDLDSLRCTLYIERVPNLDGEGKILSQDIPDNIPRLDNGLIPASMLPSYVDDVVEGYFNEADNLFYEDSAFTTAITGESGKIYIDTTTGNTYRFGGSIFARINPDEYTVATNADIDALFNK